MLTPPNYTRLPWAPPQAPDHPPTLSKTPSSQHTSLGIFDATSSLRRAFFFSRQTPGRAVHLHTQGDSSQAPLKVRAFHNNFHTPILPIPILQSSQRRGRDHLSKALSWKDVKEPSNSQSPFLPEHSILPSSHSIWALPHSCAPFPATPAPAVSNNIPKGLLGEVGLGLLPGWGLLPLEKSGNAPIPLLSSSDS